jgi:hypothetical protein
MYIDIINVHINVAPLRIGGSITWGIKYYCSTITEFNAVIRDIIVEFTPCSIMTALTGDSGCASYFPRNYFDNFTFGGFDTRDIVLPSKYLPEVNSDYNAIINSLTIKLGNIHNPSLHAFYPSVHYYVQNLIYLTNEYGLHIKYFDTYSEYILHNNPDVFVNTFLDLICRGLTPRYPSGYSGTLTYYLTQLVLSKNFRPFMPVHGISYSDILSDVMSLIGNKVTKFEVLNSPISICKIEHSWTQLCLFNKMYRKVLNFLALTPNSIIKTRKFTNARAVEIMGDTNISKGIKLIDLQPTEENLELFIMINIEIIKTELFDINDRII